jgi:hypothetical protein
VACGDLAMNYVQPCFALKKQEIIGIFFSIALRTLGVVALYSSTQLFNLFSQDELI